MNAEEKFLIDVALFALIIAIWVRLASKRVDIVACDCWVVRLFECAMVK